MVKASQTKLVGIIVVDNPEFVPPKGVMTAFKQTVRRGKLPIVFVGTNTASKTLMQTLQKAYQGKRPMFYVKTLEEARQILQELLAKQETDTVPDENTME